MNKLNIFNTLYIFVGVPWLVLMLMFPSTFTEIKYILIIMLIFLSIVEIIIKNKKLNSNLIKGISVWLFYFSFSLIVGVLNGFSIDYSLINMYFITPIVAFLLASIIDSEKRFIYLNKALIHITMFICLLDIIYILSRINILPFNFSFKIFGSTVISSNKLEFRITNQSSLMFLLPYVVSLYFTKGYDTKYEKFIIILTLILGFIVTLLSGRRALQGVFFLSFLLTFLFINIRKGNLNVKLKSNPIKILLRIIIVIIILCVIIGFLNKLLDIHIIEAFYKTFLSAFDISESSTSKRVTQTLFLIEGWGESPIIGHGINSYSKDFLASSKTPWSYEMIYIALLFQTGILGTSIFFVDVYFISKKLYKKSKLIKNTSGNYFLAILIGYLCFVISGATNPLLYYVWAWALVFTSYQIH